MNPANDYIKAKIPCEHVFTLHEDLYISGFIRGICNRCGFETKKEKLSMPYYKQYFKVAKPTDEEWRVYPSQFRREDAHLNFDYKFSDFHETKGMTPHAASSIVTRWNQKEPKFTRYYLDSGNAKEQANKLNNGTLKPKIIPITTGKDLLKMVAPKVYNNPVSLMIKLKQPEAKKGDVRKLPKVNSPMWTDQWSYQGSGQQPYIISRKKSSNQDILQSTSWACSCPAWTRNMPREDCKHILKVKLMEKVPLDSAPVQLLPKEQQDLFNKFLKEQAAAGTPAVKSDGFKPIFKQGRKFR